MKNNKKIITVLSIIIITVLVIVIYQKQTSALPVKQVVKVSHMVDDRPDYNFYRSSDLSFGCNFYSKDNIVYNIIEGVDDSPPRVCEISQADKGTFRVLDFLYTKDINAVYYWCNKIDQADPGTFEAIYSGDAQGCESGPVANFTTDFAIDKNYVFHQGKIDSMFDRASFEYLGSGYIKTKDGIFFNNKKILEADIKTFEFLKSKSCGNSSLCDYNAQDKNHKYKYGEIVK